MKTNLECIPCFLKQAISIMDLHNLDKSIKEETIRSILKELSGFNLKSTPPEFALPVYDIISRITNNPDPYLEVKKKDNLNAIKLLPQIQKIIGSSANRLKDAVKIAISANIMDFAANPDYDLMKRIKHNIDSDFTVSDFTKLEEDIKTAKSIAYITDNAGEIVIDTLLIKEIKKMSKAEITVFVRAKPIINDATIEDAKTAGIDKLSNVKIEKIEKVFPFIENSGEFINFLKKADVVIAKGQANYECLSEFKDSNIYFLLIPKCIVIARDLNVKMQGMILKCNRRQIK